MFISSDDAPPSNVRVDCLALPASLTSPLSCSAMGDVGDNGDANASCDGDTTTDSNGDIGAAVAGSAGAPMMGVTSIAEGASDEPLAADGDNDALAGMDADAGTMAGSGCTDATDTADGGNGAISISISKPIAPTGMGDTGDNGARSSLIIPPKLSSTNAAPPIDLGDAGSAYASLVAPLVAGMKTAPEDKARPLEARLDSPISRLLRDPLVEPRLPLPLLPLSEPVFDALGFNLATPL